jgi:putative peptide zinc metalloprotease protein
VNTFSESWYRVANQRICLRPGVKVRRQTFRGERWIVLENPFSNEFFRLRPAAYEFVARLRPDRTVQEVWQQCLDRFPDEAPGQEAVIQLLSQLYFANLLQYDLAADSAQLFERFKKRRQRELGLNLMNIMFMRFPLLDPDRFLVRAMPVAKKLISAFGAVLWLVVVGAGIKVAVDHFDSLKQQGEGILATDNLLLLYCGLVIIKAIHEFGHAFFCRRFGGEVHVMGVMLMIFTPMPYVDATSSWSFRNRWQRTLVGAAGMISELFVAAIMVFVWANTAPGMLHSLAYNMMFVASVSTLIFNINPLLRFDGYYILSDLLEIPNLNQRAVQQLQYLAEHYLFGVEKAQSPASTRREAGWFTFYGIASGIYRVIVFSGVLFTVADRFLIIGLVMAAVCLISWVTVPVIRFVRYLSSSPQLDRVRARAVAVTLSGAVILLILLDVVPFPSGFRAPGVVVASQRTQIANPTSGWMEAMLAPSGSTVKAGQPLLRFRNPELDIDITSTQARLDEVDSRLLNAMQTNSADIAPLTELRNSVSDQLKKLNTDKANLIIRAPHDGIWVSPGLEDYIGREVNRGSALGLLVNPAAFEFVATVREEDGDALFGKGIRSPSVRLSGDAGTPVSAKDWRVIPGEQKTLPSAALGWKAGGDVPVSPDDNSGSRTMEPFFEVVIKLDASSRVPLLDGRSGKVRFGLPAEPLLPRWTRSLWQLLQKRYQV